MTNSSTERTRNSYKAMHARCSNPNNPSYKYYGAKGVRVCKQWARPHGFVQFCADMGLRPEDTTLDRKDSEGDYTPDNCRWATATEQAENKSNVTLYEHKGRKQSLTAWSGETGIPVSTLRDRLFYFKWSFQRAISVEPEIAGGSNRERPYR